MPEPIIIKGGSAEPDTVNAQADTSPTQTEAAQTPGAAPATMETEAQGTATDKADE